MVDKLKLWRESVKEYCEKNKKKYTIPKKGSIEHAEISKIYNKKLHCSCKGKCSC